MDVALAFWGTIPPRPKSLDVSPNDLLDEDEKVLKFDAIVNECLKMRTNGRSRTIPKEQT